MKITFVDEWLTLLWRAWSIRIAAIGVALPELLQLIADNTSSMDWLDSGWKSIIRLVCLVGVVLARPIKQASLEPRDAP